MATGNPPPSTARFGPPSWFGHLEDILYGALAALIYAWFAAICLHGIGSDWQWGHNGYNGAAFYQAARNSLRFHIIGQALYYSGTTPPGVEDIYTHHPMMLHFHLIAAIKLLGDHEWVGRLIPAFYSFAGLGMVHLVAGRTFGRAVALCAIALYALTPLHAVFANMIDHEQGCIFWCLVLIYAYIRWLETPTRAWLAAMLCAVTVAMQFDWPAYYLAFILACHAFGTGLLRGGWNWRWRKEFTLIAVFSVVVLVNAGGFFWWIKHLRGGLAEMGNAFTGRTSATDGYYPRLWARSLDLQGPLLIGLGAAWLPLLVARIARGKAHMGDFAAAAFALMQLTHSLVFKQAGFIHCYWTYYASPALAIGGGLVLVTAVRAAGTAVAWLVEKLRGWQPAILAPALHLGFGALAAVPMLQYQVPATLERMDWGFRGGSGSYIEPYDAQLPEVAFAKTLQQFYPRTTTFYLQHGSMPGRIEFQSSLDAPRAFFDSFSLLPAERQKGKRTVLIADLVHVTDRAGLQRLAQAHPTRVFGRRFFAIEVDDKRASLETFVAQPLPTPGWWRWLVHPDRGPTRWVPATPRQTVAGLFEPQVRIARIQSAGGTGGSPMTWDCAPGEVVATLDGRVTSNGSANLLGGLQASCQPVTARQGSLAAAGALQEGPFYGGNGADGRWHLACNPGDVAIGLHGRAGALVDAVGLVCARHPTVARDATGAAGLRSDATYRTAAQGGPGGLAFELKCPPGSVFWGLRAQGAALIDQVGLACATVDGPFLGAARAPALGGRP